MPADTATSPTYGSPPRPSTIVPPLISRSKVITGLYGGVGRSCQDVAVMVVGQFESRSGQRGRRGWGWRGWRGPVGAHTGVSAKEHHHANQSELHHAAVGGGGCRGSCRRRTDGRRSERKQSR